jgi:hypothetical protein
LFQSPEVSNRRVSALNSWNVLECEEGLAAEVVGCDDVVVEDGELHDGVVAAALIGKGRTEKMPIYNYMMSFEIGYCFDVQISEVDFTKLCFPS